MKLKQFARWLLADPCLWSLYAARAAFFEPARTLIRGAPWDDTQ